MLFFFLPLHSFQSLLWRCVLGQAERDLQPWIARDDEQGQKMWRINQRIVKLMVEMMRNHDRPEALIILSSASDLLLRATDGMLVDGEACTLPQLEVKNFTLVLCITKFLMYAQFYISLFFGDYEQMVVLQAILRS